MYFTESNQRRRSDKTQNEKEATINLTNKQKKRIQSNLIWFISPKKKKRKIDEKKKTKKNPTNSKKTKKKQKKKRN